MHKNKTKEPLFHIAKRAALPWYLSWAIRIGAIVLALVACAALTVFLTHENPFQVYATMFRGAFSTPRRIWNLLQSLAMLLCVSLALTPAFKMRFWNIGGEGQVLIGGLATAACMICLGGKIPNALLILTMIVASMLAGAIWALIPAFFKAQYNTNETLFTLMMNYVAIQLVAYFVIRWEVPKGSGKIGIINQTTRAGWLPVLGEHDYLLNILIVLALTVFMSIYLKYSKHGYEISVVGESVNTARYIGINVKKVILRTMALSGAVCGIAGLLLVGGTDHTITTTTADNRGFTAIMVSWLAKFSPAYMILTSFLLVFLQKGADELVSMIKTTGAKYAAQMDAFQLHLALEEAFKLIQRANKYIDESTPWVLARDESKRARLATVMYNLLEALRVSLIMLKPFIPASCEKAFAQIGADENSTAWENVCVYGVLPATVSVHKGETLFPRIDMAKALEELEKLHAEKKQPEVKCPPVLPDVTIDEFAKCDMRVCKVLACEAVKKSDKLLKFTLDDGSGTPRQILSGIHKFYEPETLVGKTVVAILNLPPRKMMGQMSNGMLLSAVREVEGKEELHLVILDDSVPAGSQLC